MSMKRLLSIAVALIGAWLTARSEVGTAKLLSLSLHDLLKGALEELA